MVEIHLLPVTSLCTEPGVGKYKLLRTDTGRSAELLFYCLSAYRYDPLFRLWRGEAKAGDTAAAQTLFRSHLKLAAADSWRFIGKNGRVAAQKEDGQSEAPL